VRRERFPGGAIVERHNQRKSDVILRQILGFDKQPTDIRVQPRTLADHPHANVVLM